MMTDDAIFQQSNSGESDLRQENISTISTELH